jgi:hypothetical protein
MTFRNPFWRPDVARSPVRRLSDGSPDYSTRKSTGGFERLCRSRLLPVVVLAAIAGGGGAPQLGRIYAATSPTPEPGAAPAIAGEAAQAQPVVRYVNHVDATCGGHSPCYGTIQAAVKDAQEGDTVHIQAGTYVEQVDILAKNNNPNATEASRIIIQADPAAPVGSVVLQGASSASGRGTWPVSRCTQGQAIRLLQSKFITIRGLTITGAGGEAIALMGGNNRNEAIHIERNRIFGNGSSECNGGIVAHPISWIPSGTL